MVRHRPSVVLVLAGALAAPLSPAALAGTTVVSISPGELDRSVEVAIACPTFSWAAVEGAAGYELAVLDLARPDEPRIVLRHRVVGAGLSWTPSREACLAPGASYAWTLRPLDPSGAPLGGEESWASLRRFGVPAFPTAVEVAAALKTLRRWQAGEGRTSGGGGSRGADESTGKAIETSGSAAIRGENPGTGANQHGVWGQAASATGGGLVGVNIAGGPDLVLDGAAQSQADTNFSQSGIDRPSASPQTFGIQNTGGGGMSLQVQGTAVSLAGHLHAGEEIASGTVADARIASTLTRDTEVLSIVLANDGAGSGLDADLLDGVHAATFQVRVTGTCPSGDTLQGINADGSVLCFELPRVPVLSTVDDPPNAVGEHTAIALGSDGFPVISYYDATAGVLKVAKCNDAACTGANETVSTVDDPANLVGGYTSIALGTDGFPVISYYDFTANALKVAKCNDAACAGANETVTTVDDSANVVGGYTSIAIGTDGFPVISYFDVTAGSLKVAKCNDAACAGADETLTTVDDPAGAVGYYTSIAIGTDGFPVISYTDASASPSTLKVAKCNDAACAGADETLTTVDDPANDVGLFTSIALGTDGFPVIGYYDSTAGALKVAKCNDAACAGADETVTTVDDPANDVGQYASIALGTDGFPVISYYDSTAGALKVTKCNDAACAGANETVTTVDDPADAVGEYASLALGTDGFPVIGYRNATAGALEVIKCSNRSCRN